MSLLRRVMAGIAQLVALLLILVFTGYGAFYAWSWAKTIRFFSDQLLRGAAELRRSGMAPDLVTPQNLEMIVQVGNLSDPIVWFVIGGVLGFLISSAVASVIFMLAEIAHNTRRTVAFFEQISSR